MPMRATRAGIRWNRPMSRDGATLSRGRYAYSRSSREDKRRLGLDTIPADCPFSHFGYYEVWPNFGRNRRRKECAMYPIDHCPVCWDLARQASVIANNQLVLAGNLDPTYQVVEAAAASMQLSSIEAQLQRHGHTKEAMFVRELSVLLAYDLNLPAPRAHIIEMRDELRVALGLQILVSHPIPRASKPGDDELSVA